jgi:hypothetical protein
MRTRAQFLLFSLALGCSVGTGADDSTSFITTATELSDSEDESGDGDGDTGDNPFCGDQFCDPLTESCQTCQADCDECPYCGDGMCNGEEDCMLCALDCEVCPGCGDGMCMGPDETCASCPQDCTENCEDPFCGDGSCNGNEGCTIRQQDCEQDCGICGPVCPDGECNGPESCGTCPQDCGECVGCPDNSCGADESCVSCPQDCGQCTCPCSNDPNFNNFCHWPPGTQGCPMTQAGGYCDPNGDGSYDDADWNFGYFDYLAQCG